ncbi:MAG: glycosyltransferase, partial [Pseudomonadota bacterium]
MAPTFRLYLSPQLAQQFASAEFNRHLHDRSLVPTQELDDADLVLLSGDEALPETAAPVNWLEPGRIDGRIVLRHNLAALGELEPVSVAAALTDLPPVPQIGSRDEARKAFVEEALHHSVPAQAEPLADLIAQWAHTAAPALPKISVIINNYNYAAYLADAIDSALGQSIPCHEVIVVDDGSTDESRDIIAHYDQVTPVLKANGGQASAFNAGFAASSGDVVLFLDADDRLRPDAVETVQAELRGLTSRMSFGLQIIGSDGRPLGLFHMSRAARQDQVAGRLLEDGFFFIMPTSGNAFPRWVLDTLLPMPEPEWKISADLYLSLAAALLGPTRHLDKVLADYRVHGQNSFHQRLGPQPYQNPRKFAQRRAALETMCHEIARGRFGSSSDRDRLRAQLLKSSEFWVERWAGRALDWWSQRPASPERPIIPTKMRMDETQIRPPAHIRRLLCQRDPFLFGGRSTWPAQRLSEWTDLANATTGVLGRGWDLRGGE